MALNDHEGVATQGGQFQVSAELRLVPLWAWMLGALGLLIAQYFFNVILAKQSDAPAAWICALMGVAAGVVLACYLAFIGYISRDAKRRRMSSTLWTIVATVIPNGFGILLYFLLRQSLSAASAGLPSSGSSYGSCPACGYALSNQCQHCRSQVAVNDSYCRSCGSRLGKQQIIAT